MRCYVILALLFMNVTAYAQGRDYTIGGLVTESPLNLGAGVANVGVTLECDATGSIVTSTDANGIWSTEVFSEDLCVITFDAPGFDLYQQREIMLGEYRTYMSLIPLCTTARAPETSVSFFTDPADPAEGQNIVTHAITTGGIPCENCQSGPYNVETCRSGDWDGNGYTNVVSDLDLLYRCLFLDDCIDVCYWAADMDGDYMLTARGDIEPFEQSVAFNNPPPDELPTCQEVAGE